MKKVLLVLITLFIFAPKSVFASTSLKITNKIENIINPIDAKITYEIIPHAENPNGVENDLTEYILDFTNTEVTNNEIVKEDEIDFSNVEYTIPGIYRYGIRQKYTSDTNIVLTRKTYEIYVNVTLENENLVVDVQPLVFDFKDLEKKELEYSNEIKYKFLTIRQELDGDYKEIDKNVYFKYKLTFYGKVNDTYTITGQDEIVNYNDEQIETNKVYIVNDTEEENYVYIYLKDNDEITIGLNELEFNEIPDKIEYKITKVDGEKWSTSINGKERDTYSNRIDDEHNKILVINSRDYDNAITGLFYNVFPFVIIIPFIILDFIVFRKMKLKKKM